MENSEIFSQTIRFRGHQNVLGTHRNTLEITMDQNISRRADCIIGVEASCGCAGLNAEIKNHIKAAGHLQFEIFIKGLSYVFTGRGSPDLGLLDPHEMVFRKSNFVSSRTAAISCSAAAINVPRDIIRLLQNPQNFGVMKILALNKFLSLDPEVPTIEFF
jgi:hypothetical protein